MTKPGTLLDAFTLETAESHLDAEMRLVLTDDGTESIWHYENGRHAFTHPANRCLDCRDIITSSSVGRCCWNCVDEINLV